ncbi:hypothetical protein AWB79_07339 [Caballeronia hypogeia]|uniref:Uncharacterized protein n=2 Tax=Caballeronia hypogeia TaxID=1777140 RepID=A0A158DPC4_9BURK|nr:hypothetical protein AWB79_07339 [Caballeronia hypogeia]
MNKSYRSIWNEKVGTFVAVAETAMACGKKSSGGAVCDSDEQTPYSSEQGASRMFKASLLWAAGVGITSALFGVAPIGAGSAWAAGGMINACSNGSGYGLWTSGAGPVSDAANAGACGGSNPAVPTGFNGVYLTDDFGNAQSAYMAIGNDKVILGAKSKIQFQQVLDMYSNKITNLADGAISSGSMDAVNGGQLFTVSSSLSTAVSSVSRSLSTGISSLSTNMSSLSTAWNSASTSLSTGVSSISTGWNSASTSLSTGMSSISTAWSSVSTGVSSLSTSTSTAISSMSSSVSSMSSGISSLSTGLSSLSTSTSTAFSSMSSSVSSISTGMNSLSSSTSTSINSLSTGLRDAVMYDDSTHSTVTLGGKGTGAAPVKVTNVADGTSATDAISYTDSQVNVLQGQVSGVARSAYSGIAAASAMAMIPNIDQDKNISVGVGGATYQGYAAAGLAVNLRVTQNLVMKAGAAKSNGGTVYGANASYRW